MSEPHLEPAGLLKREAARLGFDACAIAAVSPIDPEDRLGSWLARGFHADMHWMAHTRALRQDVRLLLPGARSVIVVAKNYYQPRPAQPEGAGKIARYAWGRDYHKVLKKPLRALASFLQTLVEDAESRLSIDSAPVMERSWAERAGIGWVGKNSLILRRDLGSWFLLGAVVTTADLAPDAPVEDLCGSCTACIDACPTQAIVAPEVVDATRCIAYHTIENRGAVPESIAAQFGAWVFGCDVCQEVCPWNRFVQPHEEPGFAPREEAVHPALDTLLQISQQDFDARYAGSPVRRAKHTGMQRNVRIAASNMHRQTPAAAPGQADQYHPEEGLIAPGEDCAD